MILSRKVRYEQAVYGSFRFWSKGYAMLAQSPGCRPEWLQALRDACQKFGEPPLGVSGDCGIFAISLPDRVWMVVGAHCPGTDDRGRSGALTFHALFFTASAYRALGCSPFGLAEFRSDWGPETKELPTGTLVLNPGRSEKTPFLINDHARKIAQAIMRGRKILVESEQPIHALASMAWSALPIRVRAQSKVATWAFAEGNGFDLIAAPKAKVGSITLNSNYVNSVTLTVEPLPKPGLASWITSGGWIPVAAALALIILIVSYWGRQPDAPTVPNQPDNSQNTPNSQPQASLDQAPDRSTYANQTYSDQEISDQIKSWNDFAQQFSINAPPAPTQPAHWIKAVNDQLRYPGPWLSNEELDWLKDDPQAGPYLSWHQHLLLFAKDRPLPDDFEQGPPAWQFDYLVWSFHQNPQEIQSISSLQNALAKPFQVTPHPLEKHYSALKAYASFLKALPD